MSEPICPVCNSKISLHQVGLSILHKHRIGKYTSYYDYVIDPSSPDGTRFFSLHVCLDYIVDFGDNKRIENILLLK